MIELPGLPRLIDAAGPPGAGLRSLAKSPTFHAAVGVLATRTALEVKQVDATTAIEFYLCQDDASAGNRIPSPFALVCLDAVATSSKTQADRMFVNINALLQAYDLHRKPAIVLLNALQGEITSQLRFSETPTTVLDPADLVEVLMAHPPRAELMRRIVLGTPIGLLNPYYYRGPISRNMFRGRQEQLQTLISPKVGYPLDSGSHKM